MEYINQPSRGELDLSVVDPWLCSMAGQCGEYLVKLGRALLLDPISVPLICWRINQEFDGKREREMKG